MSTDSITSATTDDPNTLIPLLTFILTDKEDCVVEVPILKASRAGDADIGPVITPLNPNVVKPRQYDMMRLLANRCPKSMITHTNMLSEKEAPDDGVGFDKSI
jgi:hypothetical protein